MTSTPQTPRPVSFPPLERRAPEEVGLPAPALLALADRLQEEGLDPHALLVARGGVVAFETAWRPYRLDLPALVYSASKTYASLAIGFLADEGRLDLGGSAADLLGLPDPHGITVRHLLTMNTGHTAAQIERIGFDPAALLATAPQHAPGDRFAYNSPATYALSAIVTALTGEQLTAYLRPRLLDPLGIGDRWMSSEAGIELGASGFHLTVEDLARTATMLGAGGAFAGRQVVPAWYVEEMSRPWSDTAVFDGPATAEGEQGDWALGYGYQVWRGRHGFRLDGAAGQFGLVIPEHDLVIAYQGATLDTQATLRAFWAFVDAVAVAEAAGGAAGSGAVGADAGAERPSASVSAASGEAVPVRDSWGGRALFSLMREARFDTVGLALADAGARAGAGSGSGVDLGWVLTLPGVGTLAVTTSWHAVVCEQQAEAAPAGGTEPVEVDPACPRDAEPRYLRLATRGERRDDGSVLVHVVDTTSPHRAIVERDAEGRVEAGWHIPPLGGGWDALRVPASVTRVVTTAAALLLDMDGTLVDSHAVVERLWTRWSLDHGVDPERTLAVIHGRQGQESMAILLPDRPHETNVAENAALLAAETAETAGVVAIPGAAELLASLERDGVPYALVTSATTELATARMRAAGLPLPPVVIAAADVERSKPDPEGFLAGAAALGVDPARCIVVEDSANGIAAGLAAGMRVIGVGPHAAEASPTWVVPDATAVHVSATAGIRISLC